MKRILVEGLDGTGKTTLLSQLGHPYIELTAPPKGVTSEQWYRYFVNAYSAFDVIGRSHYSELVYGTMIRNEPILTPEQAVILDSMARSIGFEIIYLFADPETIRLRIEERPGRGSDYDQWVYRNVEAMDQRYRTVLPSRTHFIESGPDTLEQVRCIIS